MSFLINFFWFCFLLLKLLKINQTPIPANTIRIDKNWKEISVVVVKCSETESVNGSRASKNGFIAFRYLNAGSGVIFEKINAKPPTIDTPKKMIEFRSWFSVELIFLIKQQIIKKIVGKINATPP